MAGFTPTISYIPRIESPMANFTLQQQPSRRTFLRNAESQQGRTAASSGSNLSASASGALQPSCGPIKARAAAAAAAAPRSRSRCAPAVAGSSVIVLEGLWPGCSLSRVTLSPAAEAGVLESFDLRDEALEDQRSQHPRCSTCSAPSSSIECAPPCPSSVVNLLCVGRKTLARTRRTARSVNERYAVYHTPAPQGAQRAQWRCGMPFLF